MHSPLIKKYLLFLAFMLMITIYLPIFNSHVRFNIGSYKYWAVLWLVSVILLAPQTIINKFVFYVFIFWFLFSFILPNTLYGGVDEWNKRMTKEYLYQIMLSISLFEYFKNSKDHDGLALLVKWTLLFITITAVMSIFSSTVDPMYARKLIGSEYTKDELLKISKYGGGSHGFAGALLFLFPMIIFFYRNSLIIPFSKPVILVFGILCFLAVLRMQIFANILISVSAIVFSLAGAKNIRKSLTFGAVILIIIALIPRHFYISLLIFASSYFNPNSENYFKLNDIASFVETGQVNDETSAGGRLERYPLLWEGFKGNPATGFYNSNSSLDIAPGGHLFWMNRLTVYGILGFVPFILIFYFHIKRSINQFDSEFSFYFLLSVFAGLGLGLIKNIAGMEEWGMFFFILPGMYYLPLLKKTNSNVQLNNLKKSGARINESKI
jgi:hypothetical protein